MPINLDIALADLPKTTALGAHLAELLQTGDTVLLFGDLGAGKTSLARGMIERLTGETDAPSPTFTLVQHYESDQGFVLLHSDLYRLETEEELDELGFDEALDHGALIVEWPDKAPSFRPEHRLEIVLKPTQLDARMATLTAFGNWTTRLKDLEHFS